MTNTRATHESMRLEHQEWREEHATWLAELAEWKVQQWEATTALKRLPAEFPRHGVALLEHARAIRAQGQGLRRYEAGFSRRPERGLTGPPDPSHLVHLQWHRQQQRLRGAHGRARGRHEQFLAGLRPLVTGLDAQKGSRAS